MKKKVYDVVIVGAGMAGLSAALEAKKRGLSFIVLDARDRIGGRVVSKKLKGGLVVELGAEWIGKTHKELLSFCREYSIPLETHRYTDVRYYTKENKKMEEFPLLLEKFETFIKKQKVENVPYSEDAYSFFANHFSNEELRILSRVYGPDFATHLRYVAARDALLELLSGGENDHMDYHVKGGNTKILDALHKEIGKKNVHLNEVVNEISDNGVVTIKTIKKSYEARSVLVTAGLKQLKNITVTPPLKVKRQKANKLSYGDITKAFISFKGNLPFKKQKLAFFSETDIPYVYVTTQGQSESRFGLCVYAVGTAAKKIANMKEEVFIKKVLKILPKDISSVDGLMVEDVFVQHWGSERFSEGAYCIFNPSEHKDIKSSFGIPHGNIYFAGDYLGVFFNYMNGAFQSGRDTMKIIDRDLKK